MVLNAETIKALSFTVSTLFNKALKSTEPWYPKIATVVKSSTSKNIYPMMESLVSLREWVDERFIQNLKAQKWEIENKSFEATVGINKEDIEDDNTGVYSPMIEELGRAAAKHPDKLVAQLLLNGHTSKIWDGKNFFDTGHPVGKDLTFDNKFGLALTADNYATVRAAMMQISDPDGKPLGIVPNLLVVPPQLEATARQILNAEIISSTTNIWRNSADLMVIPELASEANRWFLLDTSRALKPFIVQMRKRPQLVRKDKVSDDNVFFFKKLLYGVDYRGNAGFGLWQIAAASDPDWA